MHVHSALQVFYLVAQRLGIPDAYRLFAATAYYAWVPFTEFLTAAETLLYVAEDMREGIWLQGPYPIYTAEVLTDAFLNVGIGCAASTGAQRTEWTCSAISR